MILLFIYSLLELPCVAVVIDDLLHHISFDVDSRRFDKCTKEEIERVPFNVTEV